jgi:hypothetical protein
MERIIFFSVVGSIVVCVGVGLYIFGMLSLDKPLVPIVGVGVVVGGIFICILPASWQLPE